MRGIVLFDDVLTVFFSIVMVLAVLILTYFATKWLARRCSLQGARRAIKIIDRELVGQDKSLMIIRVADKTMLLGMTSHQITKLCDIDDERLLLSQAESAGFDPSGSFLNILKNSLGLKSGAKEDKEDRAG